MLQTVNRMGVFRSPYMLEAGAETVVDAENTVDIPRVSEQSAPISESCPTPLFRRLTLGLPHQLHFSRVRFRDLFFLWGDRRGINPCEGVV